jgi:hypothetical protein
MTDATDDTRRADDEPPTLPFSLEQESFFRAFPVTSANLAVTHRVTGPLDTDALRAAARLLLLRHEALRFRPAAGDPPAGQVIAPAADCLETARVPASSLWEHVDEAHSAPLDLAAQGPTRFRLYQVDAAEHVLCTTVHPAALDAWGIGIVNRELWELYDQVRSGSGAGLPGLPYTFSDHVRQQCARGGQLTPAQRSHHLGQLAGLAALAPAFPFPTASDQGAGHGDTGHATLFACEQFSLDELALGKIEQAAKNLRVTVPALFLAGFELALCLAAGTGSGGLSYVYLGRDRPGSEGMAAAMARRLPLRFEVAGSDSLGDFAGRAMRDWALGISNCGPPYGSARLVEAAGGPAGVLEPVFNFRLARAPRPPTGPPGAAQPRPVVRQVYEPRPRPVPMWPQFGTTALFAVLTMGTALSVTAVYDPRAVPSATVTAVFSAYERVTRTVADGGAHTTVGQLRTSSGQ